MIEIIQANSTHRKAVIDLLDEFIVVCNKLVWKDVPSFERKNYENEVFDTKIMSADSVIFLAKENDSYIGIITLHKISLIRRWIYDAEIEEMFVKETYQWTEVAQKLLDTGIAWVKENNIRSIQLKSHDLLHRAHKFYEKNGFTSYGKAFEKKL